MNRCVLEVVSFFVYDIPISYLFYDTMTMLTLESFGSIITTRNAKHLQHVLYSMSRRLGKLGKLDALTG